MHIASLERIPYLGRARVIEDRLNWRGFDLTCNRVLADEFKLTQAEREEMLPSGRITLFANRVHWAKTYLKQGIMSVW